MVRDGGTSSVRRRWHRNRSYFALHVRHACAAGFLWHSFPSRNLSHARRTCRLGGNAGVAAGHQCSHARHRTSPHRSPCFLPSRGQFFASRYERPPPGQAIGTDPTGGADRTGRHPMTASPGAGARSLDLSVSFAGIQLKNPVIAASGTFAYGIEFEDVVHLDKLGGFVVKGLSREPMAGNPPPRLYETPAGMLNAIGLQNIGARAFLEEKLPKLRTLKNVVIFANVFGYTREDYEHTIQVLNEGEGIAAY